MSRYIDADALRKEHCEDCNAIKDDPNCDICATMQWVNDAPTADVAPVVHGRWIPKEENVWNLEMPVVVDWLCSECNISGHYTLNFCPNCGARMDG